ncbi:hypothetical protein [Caballeronia sp. J97]|nr:hypothetical protein [Caballeronia sp. J97]
MDDDQNVADALQAVLEAEGFEARTVDAACLHAYWPLDSSYRQG